MARKIEQKTINGRLFKYYPLGFSEGVETLAELTELVGPTFKAIVNSGVTSIADLDVAVVVDGVIELAKGARAKQLMPVLKRFGAKTEVEVSPGVAPFLEGAQFDEHFDTYGADFVPWLTFVLKAQYSLFFQSIASTLPKRAQGKDQAAA